MRLGTSSGLLIALLVAGVACGGPGASDGASGTASHEGAGEASSGAAGTQANAAGPQTAMLSVHLVDAPTDEVSSIVVTIASIEASMNGAWIPLADEERSIDLLTLQNGAFLDLGTTLLPAGHVDQVRLRLAEGGDHHVVTPDGQQQPLSIPSGEQSGIKLVGGFDLAPCSSTQLTIDFDGKKSLFLQAKPGGSGAAPASDGGATDAEWRLRPVIRIKALVSQGTCEQADAGASDADGSSADPCADVTCADTEICVDGTCRAAEP